MARNFPGPYEVEFKLSVSGLTHAVRIGCMVQGDPSPGTPIASISVLQKNGIYTGLQSAVNAYWSIVRAHYRVNEGVISCELYKYQSNSFQKDFITAMTVANSSGARQAGASPNQAGQATMTWRTGSGGIAKMILLETDLVSNSQVIWTPGATDMGNKVLSYFAGVEGWMLARDNSFPVVGLRSNYGQNEAVWRKRFRNT